MDVSFDFNWRFDLDHQVNVRDVESAGGDVCGDKHLEPALFEVVKCELSNVLRNIAVHDFKAHAERTLHQLEVVSFGLCLAED